MHEMKMPKVADSTDDYVIVSVEVAEGQEVTESDVVLVVETDKVDVEVAAGFNGSVRVLHVAPDDELSVGDIVLSFEAGS